MKRGQKVELYWDGKRGRVVPGIVTGTSSGHHITVRFVPWLDELGIEIESRFRVRKSYRSNIKYEGWAKDIATLEPHGFYRIALATKDHK